MRLEKLKAIIIKGDAPKDKINSLVEQYVKQKHYKQWEAEQRNNYNSLFYETIVLEKTVLNEEAQQEEIIQESIEQLKENAPTFEEWLKETKKVLIGTVLETDGNGVEYEKEIFKDVLIRPCVKKENYDTEINDFLANSKEYKTILYENRKNELSKLIITIDNGKKFNGDKESIADLANALKTAEEYEKLQGVPLASTMWRLYDNTIQQVTIDEIRQAYVVGNLQYSTKFIELSQGL